MPCADLLWHQISESPFFPAKNTKEYRTATKTFYESLAAYAKSVSYLETLGMIQTAIVVPPSAKAAKAAKVLTRKDVPSRRQGDDEDGTIELKVDEVKTPRKRTTKPAAQKEEEPAVLAKSPPASRKRVKRVSA